MLATVLKRISTVYFNPLMDHEVNLVDHGSIKKKKKTELKKYQTVSYRVKVLFHDSLISELLIETKHRHMCTVGLVNVFFYCES